MKYIIRIVQIVLPLVLMLNVSAQQEKLQKLVLAHYMTNMLPDNSRYDARWINPELSDPEGSTAAVGGLQQTVPMAMVHRPGMSLTEAVDFEIRAARQAGLDGFQFYYPGVDNSRALTRRYNVIIREFIRLSDTKYPGFKVSLCLCNPTGKNNPDEAEKIRMWSESIKDLLDTTKTSKAWLRTESGSLLWFLWVGDDLADGVRGLAHTPEQIKLVSAAYERLATTVGVKVDYVYQLRRKKIEPKLIDSVMKHFYAVWGWTKSEEDDAFWDYVIKGCKETGTKYTQTVYPDYYTSKTYPKAEKGHHILGVKESVNSRIDTMVRYYRVTNLAQTQLKLLRRAVTSDAAMINYVTWNDFPEGHHLSPEVNHNFGPGILLRHFKRQWLDGKNGKADIAKDAAIVFYKRYPHDAKPKFDFPLHIKSKNKDLSIEDRIELVTLLREPAECMINNHNFGTVKAGLQVHSIPMELGKVKVRLTRNGKEIIHYTAPVPITGKPHRTNRMTYSYSNLFQQEFDQLFPKGGK